MNIKKDTEQACLNLLRISQFFGHMTLANVWEDIMTEEEKCGANLEEALKELYK